MKLKRWRDAITGVFMKKEDAEKRKDTTVSETIKPRKKKEKPVKIPESGNSAEPTSAEEAQAKAFRMGMAVIYKGDIYLPENKDVKLPKESQEYLMGKEPDKWSK